MILSKTNREWENVIRLFTTEARITFHMVSCQSHVQGTCTTYTSSSSLDNADMNVTSWGLRLVSISVTVSIVYIRATAVSLTLTCNVTYGAVALRLTLPSVWCSTGNCRQYICRCLRRRGTLSTHRRLPHGILGLCYSGASGSDGMTRPTCWVRLVDWVAHAQRGWVTSIDCLHPPI